MRDDYERWGSATLRIWDDWADSLVEELGLDRTTATHLACCCMAFSPSYRRAYGDGLALYLADSAPEYVQLGVIDPEELRRAVRSTRSES